MNKTISIVADDFGITENVNDAIIDLIIKKKITDTSCIVLTENFKKDSKNLKDLPAIFGRGIHLTLTDFISFTSPKSISDNGKLPSFKKLFIQAHKGDLLEDEIAKEINSQLDIFEEFVGVKPNFIDGHQHIHQLPKISNIILNVLEDRYNGDLPCIRNTYETNLRIFRRNICLTKTYLLSFYGYFFKKKLNKKNFQTNNGFSGIYNFSDKTNYRNIFRKFIKYINNNHLLMVHPGVSDDTLEKIDPVTKTRDIEREFLLSSSFNDFLQEESLLKVPFHLSFKN